MLISLGLHETIFFCAPSCSASSDFYLLCFLSQCLMLFCKAQIWGIFSCFTLSWGNVHFYPFKFCIFVCDPPISVFTPHLFPEPQRHISVAWNLFCLKWISSFIYPKWVNFYFQCMSLKVSHSFHPLRCIICKYIPLFPHPSLQIHCQVLFDLRSCPGLAQSSLFSTITFIVQTTTVYHRNCCCSLQLTSLSLSCCPSSQFPTQWPR